MTEMADLVAVGRTVGAWGVLVWGVGKLLQWMIERSDRRIEMVIERLERALVRVETERDAVVRDRDKWRQRYLDCIRDSGLYGRQSDDRRDG